MLWHIRLLTLVLLLAFLVPNVASSSSVKAAPESDVRINFVARVSAVSNFPVAVRIGDIITGYFAYDGLTPDSDDRPEIGHYLQSAPQHGIWVSVNGTTFGTDVFDLDVAVGVQDNAFDDADRFGISSRNNLPLLPGYGLLGRGGPGIWWNLEDIEGDVLQGIGLPAAAPNLTSWSHPRQLTIFYGDRFISPFPSMVLLHADIVAVTSTTLGGRDFTVTRNGTSHTWAEEVGQLGYELVDVSGRLKGQAPFWDGMNGPHPFGTVTPSCHVLRVLLAYEAPRTTDMLCSLNGTGGGHVSPPQTSLTVSADGHAIVRWVPPTDVMVREYRLFAFPMDGSPVRMQQLAWNGTSAFDQTGGTPTCYQVAVWTSDDRYGFNDALCGFPGTGNLDTRRP